MILDVEIKLIAFALTLSILYGCWWLAGVVERWQISRGR